MSKTTPLTFVRFATEVLGIKLTRGQRVLCAIAFDGAQPKELHGDDRSLAHESFGDVEVIPRSARDVLAAMCGARAGKSYLLCAARLLHLALTVRLDTLAPGEHAFGLLVAPDLRLSRQDLRYVAGAVAAAPSIARLLIAETADSITLRRPDGKVVCIECLPATRGGSAVRGRTLFAAALDEAAFFKDDNYLVNDVEVFKAIAPRILPGGQLIIASTPWTQTGLLWEQFTTNHGSPQTALAARAATLTLRDDAHTASFVERERLRDSENAAREFDAEPMTAGTAAFFDPIALKAVTVEGMPLVLPRNYSRARTVFGLDTAFRRDASAGVIVRMDGDIIDLAEVVEIRPAKGERLVPSATIAALLERAEAHGATDVVCDQHYIESVREHTRGVFNLVEAPAGIEGKTEAHVKTRAAISESRVRIAAAQTKLLQQLREIVSKPTPGGNVTISSPRRGGSHGDIASAFVLAVWAIERNRRYTGIPVITRAARSVVRDHLTCDVNSTFQRTPLDSRERRYRMFGF